MSLPTYKQNDGKGNDSGFVPPGQQKAKKQRADLQYLLMAKGGGGGNSGGNSGGNGSGTGTDKDNNDGKGSGVENDNKEKWVEKEKDLNSKGYKGKGKYENRGKHLGWYKNGKYGDQLNPELIETTYYLNDVADPLTQVLMTYDDNDNYKAAYAYGLERFEVQALDSTRPESQDPLYYLYDGLGSVAQLTRPNGEVRDHYRYDEYGVPAPGAKLSEDGRNVNHNSFGYTGELWDEEDDLLYLRSRYYLPKIGRFMTRDAFPGFTANPLSMHKYAYVENSPVNFVDPLGFNKKEAGKGSVVQPPNPKAVYKAPNPKDINQPVLQKALDQPLKQKLSSSEIKTKAWKATLHDPNVKNVIAFWTTKLSYDFLAIETLDALIVAAGGATVVAPEIMILIYAGLTIFAIDDANKFWDDCNVVGETYCYYYRKIQKENE